MEHQAWQKYSKIKCCLYHCRMYMTGLKLLLYRLYGEVNTGWKHIRSRFSWPYIPCVARNFCGRLFLRIGDFFVLRELNFATRTDWSSQYPALTIFSFLLSTCERNVCFKTILLCASVFLCIPLCFWTKKTSCKRRNVFLLRIKQVCPSPVCQNCTNDPPLRSPAPPRHLFGKEKITPCRFYFVYTSKVTSQD